MTSIALFTSTFTQEEEIKEKLAAVSGYVIVQDKDIIDETCLRYKLDKEKVKQALYNPTSVFNKFTLERERTTIKLKLVLAEHLNRSKIIFSGFIIHLIPSTVSHILKVGVFDEKKNRIKRGITAGLTEKSTKDLIQQDDGKAIDWTEFLFAKTFSDPTLFDLVIPVGSNGPKEVVQLIIENYHKPAIMETAASWQAVGDTILATKVELALIEKGYVPTVISSKGAISLYVNKSVLRFSKLASTLKHIANSVSGVQSVEVLTRKDHKASFFRAHDFFLPPKVLLVDDEHEFVETLSERLNTRNYGSYPVYNGEQALGILVQETPDVIVLDLKMPGMSGVEVLLQAKEVRPEIEVIILTGHGSDGDEKRCMELGAFAYLQKPVDIVELTTIIDNAYKKVAREKLAHEK